MTPPRVRFVAVRLAIVALAALPALLLAAPRKPARRPAASGENARLEQLDERYAALLVRHRPDLAARYGASDGDPHDYRKFVAIDETAIDAYIRDLRDIRTQAATLPRSSRSDSLTARLEREIGECLPGGRLRTDPTLWLEIVEAALRVPVADSSVNVCERSRRATLTLAGIPEALRSATVLMRGAPAPDDTALEERLTQVEHFCRRDIPLRTEACKDSRRRAELVEADSLAAASLAQFRRWVSWRG